MNFTQELKKLNKQQRQAVEAIEGPVMVVAGPGTGKTQILTLRIANILKQTDTPPESILALTFTESAVVAMKRRLIEVIGVEAHKVAIKTIHGFCNEIIQEHPEAFPMIAGEQSISEVEQIKIIRKLLEISRQRFARDIVSSISELKREGFTPKDVSDHQELSSLFAEYQKELERTGRYDYDDMVLSVAQVLRNPSTGSGRLRRKSDLLYSLREKYLYILVDEHQDTNQSQNEVIELLADTDSPNLFVVGDAKQAIYRFQGARLENFSYFKKRFKRAAVIYLTENYRSSQTILDAALGVALGDGPLTARAPHPKKQISIAECGSSRTEPYVVARHIAQRVNAGVKPEQIAVFYHTNKESSAIARYLSKLGIPMAIVGGDDIFTNSDFKKLIVLLEAVRDFGSDYALVPALYLEKRVEPLDIAILIDTARREHRSVFSLVRDKKILEKLVPESAAVIFALYQQLSLWKALSKSFSLMPMLEQIVRRTGLIIAGAVLFSHLQESVARNRGLTLEDFLDQLEIMRDHKINLQLTTTNSQGVRLMTAHKSKGLEFDCVYITGATSSQWEGRRNRNVFRFVKKGKDEASERNLFYVALTRTRKEAVISYAKTNADGKEQLPSMFIGAIRPELKKELFLTKFENELLDKPEIEFMDPKRDIAKEEADFLREKFLDRGLSVSALNNYLDCPLHFYFVNLIGIPEAPNPKAQAGNAAHGALKYAVERRARGESVSKQEFLDRFVFLLSREPMRKVDYTESIKKGRRALGEYFDAFSKTWKVGMKCEYAVDGVMVGKIPLRGRIDRVDLLGDGRVRVIDYKFKKPMTRNEILGKTKNSDANYYRQLTFYKLLIDEGTKWRMQDGVVDFLEPASAKASAGKQEVFAPSDKEVGELKKDIKRISREILEGKPNRAGCHEKDCRYCSLRALIQ